MRRRSRAGGEPVNPTHCGAQDDDVAFLRAASSDLPTSAYSCGLFYRQRSCHRRASPWTYYFWSVANNYARKIDLRDAAAMQEIADWLKTLGMFEYAELLKTGVATRPRRGRRS
jgi:hypothetical protein